MTDPAVGALRVGQPRVEREHRHFNGEAQEKRPENPPLSAGRDRGAHQFGDIEAGRSEVRVVRRKEVDDAQEHQHAAGQRVNHELDGGVSAALASP
jgi:hypothetical protein